MGVTPFRHDVCSPTRPYAGYATRERRRARPAVRNRQCTATAVPALHAFSAVLHGVGQDTEPVDLHFEDIAGLHENGGLTRRSDATRRAGDDHITSLQTHRDTDHFNQRWDTEDELICARILHHAAI